MFQLTKEEFLKLKSSLIFQIGISNDSTLTHNEQVKRNIERFPEDFMFQLTNGEYEILKSQIVTSNVLISQNATSNTSDNQKDAILKSQNATSSWGGTRKAPYAFTW